MLGTLARDPDSFIFKNNGMMVVAERIVVEGTAVTLTCNEAEADDDGPGRVHELGVGDQWGDLKATPAKRSWSQTALHRRGLIEQIPEVVYGVSLARPQRVKTRAGLVSIHHLAPEVFGGYEETSRGAKLGTAEKALFDFAYCRAVAHACSRACPNSSCHEASGARSYRAGSRRSPPSEAAL